MNVLTRLFNNRKSTSPSELMNILESRGWARSDQYVSWLNAVCITAVMGCVRVVSEDIAKCDFYLQKSSGRDKNVLLDHPVAGLISGRPNGWQTRFEFKELLTASAMLAGNGYAYITRDLSGEPLELLPLPPSAVCCRREPGSWDLTYDVLFPNNMGSQRVAPENMFHLRGITLDGVIGADIVRYCREAFGLALAAEEWQAKLSAGGVRGSGYLSHDANLTKEQVAEYSNAFTANYSGSKNADKIPMLWGGLKFNEMKVSGREAEILETRRFQVEEICRAFRVFPQMVGYTDKTSTHAGSEQFFIAHVVHTLAPWATRWEQVVERDLLTKEDVRSGIRPKFRLQDLMRGDPGSRAEYYKNMGQCGAMTPNEIRMAEDMNPLDGLDVPLRPVNMTPEISDPNEKPDNEDNNAQDA